MNSATLFKRTLRLLAHTVLAGIPSFTAVLIAFVLALTACGGGGGGGGSDGGSSGGGSSNGGGNGGGGPPAPLTVFGIVLAPNGRIARVEETLLERLASLVIPLSHAEVSGLQAVPDGTEVQLVRLDDLGRDVNGPILASTTTSTCLVSTTTSPGCVMSTTTSAGCYSFNLAALDVALSPDLAVRAVGHGGARMRAFATSSDVDVSPVSEAAVQIVTDMIAGNPADTVLANLTLNERETLTVSIDFLTSLYGIESGISIGDTVDNIKTLVGKEPGIQRFIASAMLPGQTAEGPGDIGNLFPFAIGNVWNYQETLSPIDGQISTYDNVFRITKTQSTSGVPVYVAEESNPGGTGEPEDHLWSKDSRDMTLWGTSRGNPDDFITPLIVPYPQALFPVDLGRTVTVVDQRGLTMPDSENDEDFLPESFDVTATLTPVCVDAVTVPAGAWERAVRIDYNVTADIRFSSAPATRLKGTLNRWLAPGVGPIKEDVLTDLTTVGPGGTVNETGTLTRALSGYAL